jgi:hypothetical protein
MVGWNLEIMFMFLIAGIIFYHTCSPESGSRILGLPDRWFWAVGYSAFCVFVEVLLNLGGLLVWEYPFWNRSPLGVIPIFLFGYLHFFVAVILVLGIRRPANRVRALAGIYAVPAAMNILARGFWGWVY